MSRKKSCANLFIGFLLCNIIIACDPGFSAKISNKTDEDIIVKLQYDKNTLKEIWEEQSYIPYIKTILQNGGTLMKLDTINLIAEIKLIPTESFIVQAGIGKRPSFDKVRKISIFGKDSIILDTKDKMLDVFESVGMYVYELEIK